MRGTIRLRKRRTYNTRLIKRNLSYSLQEIAELYNVHVNAVRQWIKAGLQKIDDRKPYLIYGGDLISFLDARQSARKRKCAPDELYCCRCRAPRRPRANLVSIEIQNDKQLTLSGKCSECGTQMKQIGSRQRLDDYRSNFTVQTIAGRHIGECCKPGVMCHLDEEISHAELQSQK